MAKAFTSCTVRMSSIMFILGPGDRLVTLTLEVANIQGGGGTNLKQQGHSLSAALSVPVGIKGLNDDRMFVLAIASANPIPRL